MRIIQVRDTVTLLEVWPGRRLFIRDADGVQLFKLPTGAMSQLGASLSFGSPSRMTVQINGPTPTMRLIAKAIEETERPDADKVWGIIGE